MGGHEYSGRVPHSLKSRMMFSHVKTPGLGALF